MKKIPVLLIILLLTTIFSCSTHKNKLKHYPERFTPPGTVQISDSLFYDEGEITNQYYRDYLYWIEMVYGNDSEEWHNAAKGTDAWKTFISRSRINADELFHYFRYPVYNDYPVVGITQEQAWSYCQWRADRVFEYILVSKGIIKYDTAQTMETHFTIERFFNGQIKKLKDCDIIYYPEYSLPTYSEYKMAVAYSDSIYALQKTSRRVKEFCEKPYAERHYYLDISLVDTLEDYPLHPSYSGLCSPISNIRGNVSEWITESNKVVGGSWNDPPDSIREQDLFTAPEPTIWIGFRCVARMKKWVID
ncbi:SUMF1/EgtB/PvdO family nonheme iron enzyme [Bacteroidales bacterium OttesenSCG-928-C03]|nr:SUMF1/EgtB/PvdO family nonheme iron enzyme [Bacteroidales bacterium OttesenSCG-928-C03]